MTYLLRQIPQHCRWQKLKDIVREYCGHNASKVATIAPSHKFGHAIIIGKQHAVRVFSKYLSWCFCIQSIDLKTSSASKAGEADRSRLH